MKTKCTALTLFGVVVCAFMAFAQREFQIEMNQNSQTNKSHGERWALLIGIDKVATLLLDRRESPLNGYAVRS